MLIFRVLTIDAASPDTDPVFVSDFLQSGVGAIANTQPIGTPTVAPLDQGVVLHGTIQAGSLFGTISNSGGTVTSGAAQYRFQDQGSDGGYFSLNSV